MTTPDKVLKVIIITFVNRKSHMHRCTSWGGARGSAAPPLPHPPPHPRPPLSYRKNNAVGVISETRKLKVPTFYVSLC